MHDFSSDINISSSQNEQNQPNFYESLHDCAVYMESDYLNDIEPPQVLHCYLLLYYFIIISK